MQRHEAKCEKQRARVSNVQEFEGWAKGFYQGAPDADFAQLGSRAMPKRMKKLLAKAVPGERKAIAKVIRACGKKGPADQKIRRYADRKEAREMDENSPRCLVRLEGFLQALGYARSKSPAGRALEVAAGDGRVTRDLLVHYFGKIDCFDQDMGAVKKLEKLQRRHAH